ncbi:MAG: hypothetical protein IT257_04055 [Chitinophagaceae bacterium]|nr:hypothetical protein [Chitinophagaceae bacterium]
MNKYSTLFTLLFVLLLGSSFNEPASWLTFETGEASIQFPGKVNTESNVVDSEVGKLTMKITMYDASSEDTAENLVYGLFSTIYPDSVISSNKKETVPKFFRGAIDGAVKNVNGKLLSEKEITIGKYPGREIKVDFNEGQAVISMRCYLVKNVMYILQVITLTPKAGNASIAKFFDSFALKA